MHGTTMMFLFAVPVDAGHRHLFVPLMVGAAAHRAAAAARYGYWMFLFGGHLPLRDVPRERRPDDGWFSYRRSPARSIGLGKRADVWAQLITFTEVAALVVAT